MTSTVAPRAYCNGRIRLSSDATTTARDWYPYTDFVTSRSHLVKLRESLEQLKLERSEKENRNAKKLDRLQMKAEAQQRYQKGRKFK